MLKQLLVAAGVLLASSVNAEETDVREWVCLTNICVDRTSVVCERGFCVYTMFPKADQSQITTWLVNCSRGTIKEANSEGRDWFVYEDGGVPDTLCKGADEKAAQQQPTTSKRYAY